MVNVVHRYSQNVVKTFAKLNHEVWDGTDSRVELAFEKIIGSTHNGAGI